MKRTISSIAFLVIVVTACGEYGPESAQEGPEQDLAVHAQVSKDALKRNIAVLHELPENLNYILRCDLNSVGGVGLISGLDGPLAQGQGVAVNGWVIDEQGGPPAKVVIVLAGERSYGILVSTGAYRPDVAEAFRSDAARTSGIASLVDTTALPMGRYHVYLFEPETGAACDTGKGLMVGS